jgi:hypothetical protein
LTFWWAFFAQFFLGLSQVTCWSLIFLCFFKILFGCGQFSLAHTTMIAYCPHKASGEGGLVQIWTPDQHLATIPFNHLGTWMSSIIYKLPCHIFLLCLLSTLVV